MATLGLMSQHPGGFANHKHYYVQQQQQQQQQQQPHSPPHPQQHYTAPPPPPQQSQPQHGHMQPPPPPHPHQQPPPHPYYHSAPASSFASSPSTSSYSHPNTSTPAFFMSSSKPYDGSAPHSHPPPPPPHYYSQQPMPPPMQPVQPAAASASSAPSSAASSHQPPQPSSSSPPAMAAPSSSPGMPHMVQVNGSQYVLSSVQPASTPYPVMLIPVASNSHHDSGSSHSQQQLSHSGHHSSSASSSMSDDERKARHIKTPQQMRVLKSAYTQNAKPGKEEMKTLMKETKCSYNEVCRWFRNERHKEKKIKDGRLAMDAKAAAASSTPPPAAAATNATITDDSGSGRIGSTVDSKPVDALSGAETDDRPQSPSSSSVPSTPASSQPSSPLSNGSGAADGDRRLIAWLHVFTAEFTSEQQQAALRELISRTRSLAESGNELEGLLNGKRGRAMDNGVKVEVAAAEEANKRRKVDVHV